MSVCEFKSARKISQRGKLFRAAVIICCLWLSASTLAAHPLGNFTINTYAQLTPQPDGGVRVRYIVDMAEIPAFQELQRIGGKSDGSVTPAQLNAYAAQAAATYLSQLTLTIDGVPLPLETLQAEAQTVNGNSGLPTLRFVGEFSGRGANDSTAPRRLQFGNNNFTDRIGWHEIVVTPAPGITVYDSAAYGNGVSDELTKYPADLLAAPLDERRAGLTFISGTNVLPNGARPLKQRDGTIVQPTAPDRFAEIINAKHLSPTIVIFGLLFAMLLGALHAFSPGHGKTVVGAYLIGSRGTPKHAAFLGLTVTITHTAGVVALGLVTLFASRYILPEKLYPVLSLVSGALVLFVGLSLFGRRLRAALGLALPEHKHAHGHPHELLPTHTHDDALDTSDFTHTHDGQTHTHLPPGADGAPVTWRNLLALGISGGLLPCPSALVVMLSAITLGRVAYGLVLVIAFSVGLAATLTGIGLAFVYAGRRLKQTRLANNPLVNWLPVVSAGVIAALGVALCYEALSMNNSALWQTLRAFWQTEEPALGSVGAWAVLGIGFLYGLKHATEADHVIAVSTIVSEHKSLLRSVVVGAWWGVGHTMSLIIVGIVVLLLRAAIPAGVADWLEFGVALMIITLGLLAVRRALRGRRDVHIHTHLHAPGELQHAHLHFHESDDTTPRAVEVHAAATHTHIVGRIGLKPLLVGAFHGLAGSATLTLLVLAQIPSALLGVVYLVIFGVGSIAGMILMSGLVGVPFALSARVQRAQSLHYGIQIAAGIFSVAFGVWYAYETGVLGRFFHP